VIGQLNERILAAESILNSNLFIHTNNEKQIESLKEQNKKLLQTVELYEAENKRLSEFLKQKEEIIEKFETNSRIEQL
jgi:cell shape-determining protein MreC